MSAATILMELELNVAALRRIHEAQVREHDELRATLKAIRNGISVPTETKPAVVSTPEAAEKKRQRILNQHSKNTLTSKVRDYIRQNGPSRVGDIPILEGYENRFILVANMARRNQGIKRVSKGVYAIAD